MRTPSEPGGCCRSCCFLGDPLRFSRSSVDAVFARGNRYYCDRRDPGSVAEHPQRGDLEPAVPVQGTFAVDDPGHHGSRCVVAAPERAGALGDEHQERPAIALGLVQDQEPAG